MHVAALEEKRAELESARVAVFIVSFGLREGAAQWLQVSQCKKIREYRYVQKVEE